MATSRPRRVSARNEGTRHVRRENMGGGEPEVSLANVRREQKINLSVRPPVFSLSFSLEYA